MTKKVTEKQLETAVAPYRELVGRHRANGLDRKELEAEMAKLDTDPMEAGVAAPGARLMGMRIDGDEGLVVNVWRDGDDVKRSSGFFYLPGIDPTQDIETPENWTQQSAEPFERSVAGVADQMESLIGGYREALDDRLAGRISTEELVEQIAAINPKLEGDLAMISTVGIGLPDGKQFVVTGFYNRSLDAVANAVVIG